MAAKASPGPELTTRGIVRVRRHESTVSGWRNGQSAAKGLTPARDRASRAGQGQGSQTRWRWVWRPRPRCLRYSRAPGETRGGSRRNRSVGEPAEGSLQRARGDAAAAPTDRGTPPPTPFSTPMCTHAVASAGLPVPSTLSPPLRRSGSGGGCRLAPYTLRAGSSPPEAPLFKREKPASRMRMSDLSCPPRLLTRRRAGPGRIIEIYNLKKTFNNGSLGSGIDEERSEMR